MRTSSFFLLLALILSSSLSSAATVNFNNGQAARAVIGQGAFTDGAFAPVVNNSQTGARNLLGGASGLAYSNGRLFVADDNRLGALPNNNRVVVFETSHIPSLYSDPSTANHPSLRCYLCGFYASKLIGQLTYSDTNPGRASVPSSSGASLNRPVAVATDGRYLAIADSDNNRVLLWDRIPENQNAPADLVLGQANFSGFQSPQLVNANSLRGPQGVWIQNGKLFVADTLNHRVLIWNTIPTRNNQPADLVLGQPNFLSANHPPVTALNPATNASSLFNPTSVTSDGSHLFVSDLGYNRVLIWNSIPTSNAEAANVVVGQPDMTTSVANFSANLCGTTATTAVGNPAPCAATLNFPRFALVGGGKLFVADGGNDRVLIFNVIPTTNGTRADTVLGQPNFTNDIVTNTPASIASTVVNNTAAVDTVQSPTSLAFDGTNLYVADPYNDRVLQFSPADTPLPDNSVVNWASEIIRQEGVVAFTGTVVAADTASVTLSGIAYTYTIKTGDNLDAVARGIVAAINAGAGDANVQAIFGGNGSVYLSSKASNLEFDSISLAASASNTANLTATASGSYLTAGTAATGSPGMLVEINAPAGYTLSDQAAQSPMPAAPNFLPTTLGGVQVLVDGIPAPILSVSPSQIVIQLSYALADRSSASIYVKTLRNDGSTTATTATPVYIAPANPGLFNAPAFAGQSRPWPAQGALHQLGNPSVVVSIDGSVKATDVATITINGRAYNYTVVASDTLSSITQNLANAINGASDPDVTASVGAAFTRVVVSARVSGAAGTGISVTGSVNTGASVTVTAYTSATCCDVPQGQPITGSSPAVPGETIALLASGLGILSDKTAQAGAGAGGQAFVGVTPNTADQFVSATMNGVTAQIVSAGLPLYSYGIYYVQMIVPSTLSANPATQIFIAQNAFISNTVTVPVAAAGTSVATPGNGVTGVGRVLVSPANLVFFNSPAPGVTLSPQVVTIQNVGTAELNLASITVSGANASDFSISKTCGVTLAPLTSCLVYISFGTPATGVRTASLTISDDDTSSMQTVLLNGITAIGFEIVSQATGKALDVPGGSSADGLKIQQWEVNTNANQLWTLVPVGSAYAIMNLASGKVLDVTGGSMQDGASIQQYAYFGSLNQLWNVIPSGGGYFSIVSASSGKALDLPGGSFSDGTPIQQYTHLGNPNQNWKFVNYASFEIQNAGTASVLDVPGGSTVSGLRIQQWQPLGNLQQQWFVIPVDATYNRIVNVRSSKCLDVTSGLNANGTLIQQFDYLGGANQLWALVPTKNGNFAIVNKQTGRALDVIGGASDNGTGIQQFDYVESSQQQWRLVPRGVRGF